MSHHPRTSRTTSSEGRDLAESWLLCSAMLTLAVGWLAWSLPLPSARDALFVLLCLALVVVEQRRASARFRESVLQAGEASGQDPGAAAREARRQEEAAGAAHAEEESALPPRAERT